MLLGDFCGTLRDMSAPSRELPPPMPIRKDNFAGRTFEERMPLMIHDVLSRSGWSAEVVSWLELLLASLPRGPVPTQLIESELDRAFWQSAGLCHEGLTWDALPFFEAETVFHFALLHATGYQGEASRDPFAEAKREGFEAGLPAAQRWAELEWTSRSEERSAALELSLWGNLHDLSFQRRGDSRELIVDERARALGLLDAASMVDIILDNAGSELTCDLLASDVLLRGGKKVRLHHKPRPFFISDATARDVRWTIAELRKRAVGPLRLVGERLERALEGGQLELRTDAFWCRPLHLTGMPDELRTDIGRADVVLLKGDLNYRRIIEDRLYPFDTPAASAGPAGFPPLVALRVLKSEVLVGLEPGRAAALDAAQPGWLTSGETAIVQVF
jgi:hypothetical protein